MNGRREARQDHAARSRSRQFFDARNNGAFRRRVTGALDVGGIAEQRKDSFIPVASERMNIEAGAFDRRVINLEVAGVDDDA
jgi:hypothetical protein